MTQKQIGLRLRAIEARFENLPVPPEKAMTLVREYLALIATLKAPTAGHRRWPLQQGLR